MEKKLKSFMNIKILGIASLLCAGFSLQASTTLTMGATNGTGLTDGSDYVSPYTGYLANYGGGTTGISLYCDDAADSISPPSSYTAYVTALANAGNTPNPTTRFASATGATDTTGTVLANDGFTGALPTGVNLYEDLAWLYTQMAGYLANNTGGTSNGVDVTGLQEAAWDLTSNGGPQGASTHAKEWLSLVKLYGGTSGTNPVTGTQGTASDGVKLSVYQANYSNWVVITDTVTAGCVKGGGAGCTGSVGQEFLASIGSSAVTTAASATPEPATFGLFGCALIFGGMIARRRRASK